MQLSLIQHKFLKSIFWWNPLPSTQYYIKGGDFQNHIYIMITNFSTVWICKVNSKQIIREKQIFNQTIQIDEKQLLCFIGSKVQKYFEGGVYQIKVRDKSLQFTMKILMKIYKFNWIFELEEAKMDVGKMLREDLVQPLLMSLIVAENRYQVLEKQTQQKSKRDLNDVNLWCKFIKDKKKEELNIGKIGGWNRKLLDQIIKNSQQIQKKQQKPVEYELVEIHKIEKQEPARISIRVVKEQFNSQKLEREESRELKGMTESVSQESLRGKKQKAVPKIFSRRSESMQKSQKKKKLKFI